jgi:putative alpha-1,2-mannosidase
MVPYNLKGLIDIMGGKEAAERRLDELFRAIDASPFEDWFAGGNEPSFQIPWTYNWIGRPDKTSEIVRRILDELYFVGEGGVPGNDDMGTMGAWYVFACVGLYPMIPGVGGFTVNTPAFQKVAIHLPGGDVTIKGGPESKIYTTSLKVNGEFRDRAWIDLKEIENGGTIEYGTAAKPGSWAKSTMPPSFE